MKTVIIFLLFYSTSCAETWTISGCSMLPAIRQEAHAIEIARLPFSQLARGMVVTYRRIDGGFTTHRLIKRIGSSWWAKGDNNPLPDRELITERNYVGVSLAVPAKGMKP